MKKCQESKTRPVFDIQLKTYNRQGSIRTLIIRHFLLVIVSQEDGR